MGLMLASLRRSLPGLCLGAWLCLLSACVQPAIHATPASVAQTATIATDQHPVPILVDDLEHRTFEYFWELGNPVNGLVPDRWPSRSAASIAAVGFGLSAYGVGAERGWISRSQAIERTLATLRFFASAPQGKAATGMTGDHGFFYHFLETDSGVRSGHNELSTVDTALLLEGVLFVQSYFDRSDAREAEIRQLAETIYDRVDWKWAQARPPWIAMGWTPEEGMLAYDWKGYNEGILIYLLALGSPTHPVGADAYAAWTSTYDRSWGSFHGQPHLSFAPLFGHQYPQVWLDLRGIADDSMRAHRIDYFENSRRAVLSQQAYAIANPDGWKGYGRDLWGVTACDGPIDGQLYFNGKSRTFRTYAARGAGIARMLDDGTIAPTAAASSIAFAPDISIAAIEAMHRRYGSAIYSRYGFLDAFNPSFTFTKAAVHSGRVVDGIGWVDGDYIGIDQGPIVLMIENYRSGLVWMVMRRNPHVRLGLERAGFRGGWLDTAQAADASAPTLH